MEYILLRDTLVLSVFVLKIPQYRDHLLNEDRFLSSTLFPAVLYVTITGPGP